jgi:hypothetical protein
LSISARFICSCPTIAEKGKVNSKGTVRVYPAALTRKR